jgi:hypothetical protein
VYAEPRIDARQTIGGLLQLGYKVTLREASRVSNALCATTQRRLSSIAASSLSLTNLTLRILFDEATPCEVQAFQVACVDVIVLFICLSRFFQTQSETVPSAIFKQRRVDFFAKILGPVAFFVVILTYIIIIHV